MSNINFEKEKLLYVSPMVLDMPMEQVGVGLRKIYTENIKRFTKFLDLLLDPKSIYTRIQDLNAGV